MTSGVINARKKARGCGGWSTETLPCRGALLSGAPHTTAPLMGMEAAHPFPTPSLQGEVWEMQFRRVEHFDFFVLFCSIWGIRGWGVLEEYCLSVSVGPACVSLSRPGFGAVLYSTPFLWNGLPYPPSLSTSGIPTPTPLILPNHSQALYSFLILPAMQN